jgi:hypothetical protein
VLAAAFGWLPERNRRALDPFSPYTTHRLFTGVIAGIAVAEGFCTAPPGSPFDANLEEALIKL